MEFTVKCKESGGQVLKESDGQVSIVSGKSKESGGQVLKESDGQVSIMAESSGKCKESGGQVLEKESDGQVSGSSGSCIVKCKLESGSQEARGKHKRRKYEKCGDKGKHKASVRTNSFLCTKSCISTRKCMYPILVFSYMYMNTAITTIYLYSLVTGQHKNKLHERL